MNLSLVYGAHDYLQHRTEHHGCALHQHGAVKRQVSITVYIVVSPCMHWSSKEGELHVPRSHAMVSWRNLLLLAVALHFNWCVRADPDREAGGEHAVGDFAASGLSEF